MASAPPELLAPREWWGQIDKVGLVVSPTVLVRPGVFVDRQWSVEVQARLTALTGEAGEQPVDPVRFFTEVLDWPADILSEGRAELPARRLGGLQDQAALRTVGAGPPGTPSASSWTMSWRL